MRTKLIAIGNSKGVRIPKSVLEQCGLLDDIEMDIKGNQLVLRSPRVARMGWDAAFARMAQRGDDALLDAEHVHALTYADAAEWKW